MAAGSLTPRRAQQLSRQLSRRSARSTAGLGFLLSAFLKPRPYRLAASNCHPAVHRTEHSTKHASYPTASGRKTNQSNNATARVQPAEPRFTLYGKQATMRSEER